MIDRDSGGGDGFLRRWSKRKDAARQGIDREPDPAPGAQPLAESGDTAPVDAGAPEQEPVLTDADMPPLDSLDEHSDYSGFLSPGVSDELRRLALRKLFLQPLFNVRDGLDDYDEDFRTFEKLGEILTADMRFQQELEAERAKQAADSAADDAAPKRDEPTEDAERVAEAPTSQQAEQDAEQGSGRHDGIIEDDCEEEII